MDYRKLDPALAAALEDAGDPDERCLPVFVQVSGPLDPADRQALHDLGLPVPPGHRGALTTMLSPGEVGRLSDHPSVRYIQLSGHERLLATDP